MLFNSWSFAALCVITFVAYYLAALVPKGATKLQIAALIAASLIFYGSFRPVLLLLLLLSILLNAGASYMAYYGRAERRFAWAFFGVAVNLGILAAFKYNVLLYRSIFPSADEGTDPVLHFLLGIPLPIGISFFTFQGISLVVDAYRARSDEQRGALVIRPSFGEHLGDITLFKAFFPQLVSGPIVKAHDFLPQIGPKRISAVRWEKAFSSLVVGYFLKMVVADNLKDQTYWLTYPYFEGHSSLTLLVLLFGYSMQIFADFAGYSSIAVGLAALFGYEFPANFDYPYVSRSFSEFWTRWHISLSSWLREYLYLPLGGNRRGKLRTYVNLMLVMGLGGLWHGATWSYAIWGAWHGIMLAGERMLGINSARDREFSLRDAPRIAFVFFAVTLAWLLFRLPVFEHVVAYGWALRNNVHYPASKRAIAAVLCYSLPVILYHAHFLARATGHGLSPGRKAALLGLMIFFLVFNSGAPGAFIYFQF